MSLNSKNVRIAKEGFEYKCLFILIEGFQLMKAAKRYSIDWEEEQITAQLIHHIKHSPSRNKWRIHVEPEIRIYTEQIINGEKLPKEAAKIDLKMLSWQTKSEKEDLYHIEAKNLCENDWTKSSGAVVSSSYQLNRYINTGISNFFSGYYPSNGCVCGYIFNGNNDNIINKLNIILQNKGLNRLQLSKSINRHSLIYKIVYNNYELINVFFDYQ
jgi:hypothetical protein